MEYSAKPRSNAEVKQLAKRLRRYFGFSNGDRVDVLACLKRGTIWTVRGDERLVLRVHADSQMAGDDAVTSFEKGVVTITVKQSVYNAALMGVGRARNTISHELGHAVMHDSAPRRAAPALLESESRSG